MPTISEAELDRLHRSVEELSLLNQIATAINASMSLENISGVILAKSLERVKADQGAIFLVDDDRVDANTAHTLVRESTGAGAVLPFHLSKSLLGWMMKNRTILLMNDPLSDQRFPGSDFSSAGINSMLAVPLYSRKGLIGVLALFNKRGESGFDNDDKRFFGIVGTQTAKVIENARMFEKEAAFVARVHNQRLETMSQFVAGIAHEFNTPIGAVMGSTDLLNRAVKLMFERLQEDSQDGTMLGPKLQKPLQAIKDAATVIESGNSRLAGIVDRLENFAQLDRGEFQSVNIHENLDDCLAMLKFQLGQRIKITKDFGTIPQIVCDAAQINQVFFAVLMNAIEAISGEGTIKLATSERDNRILVSVIDTGKGISEEDITKIFNPGFTSKGTGVGTGLGLAISLQITRSHQGDIAVTSTVDQGTTVTIELPIALKSTA